MNKYFATGETHAFFVGFNCSLNRNYGSHLTLNNRRNAFKHYSPFSVPCVANERRDSHQSQEINYENSYAHIPGSASNFLFGGISLNHLNMLHGATFTAGNNIHSNLWLNGFSTIEGILHATFMFHLLCFNVTF